MSTWSRLRKTCTRYAYTMLSPCSVLLLATVDYHSTDARSAVTVKRSLRQQSAAMLTVQLC